MQDFYIFGVAIGSGRSKLGYKQKFGLKKCIFQIMRALNVRRALSFVVLVTQKHQFNDNRLNNVQQRIWCSSKAVGGSSNTKNKNNDNMNQQIPVSNSKHKKSSFWRQLWRWWLVFNFEDEKITRKKLATGTYASTWTWTSASAPSKVN